MKRFALATIMTLVGTTAFAGDGASRGYAAGNDSREFSINYWMGRYHVSREVAEYKEDLGVSIEEAKEIIAHRNAREDAAIAKELKDGRAEVLNSMRRTLKMLDGEIAEINQAIAKKQEATNPEWKPEQIKRMDAIGKIATQLIQDRKDDKQIQNLARQIKSRAERIKELCKKV